MKLANREGALLGSLLITLAALAYHLKQRREATERARRRALHRHDPREGQHDA